MSFLYEPGIGQIFDGTHGIPYRVVANANDILAAPHHRTSFSRWLEASNERHLGAGRRRTSPSSSDAAKPHKARVWLDLDVRGARNREMLRRDGWQSAYTDYQPKSTALAGEALENELRGYFSPSELRSAIGAGRHRTDEQKELIRALGVFIALKNPRIADLARLIGARKRVLYNYGLEGMELVMNELRDGLRAEIRAAIEESNEDQLRVILTALGLDPVGEAESVLEDQERAA